MKKLLVSILIVSTLLMSACTCTCNCTHSLDPSPSTNDERVCRYGNVKSKQYDPIEAREKRMDVPILVKDCTGRSLVVVWITDEIKYTDDLFTHDHAINAVLAYLDISSEYLAGDWIYSILNVTDPGAVHIYVTDEELAKLKSWVHPGVKKVVNYVDVLDSQAYKNHGTLTLNVWRCGDDFEPVA